jgi:DNA-binding GntR family transcriptional regulator
MPKQQRYEEIAADLRKKIESGEYPPGTQLPSRAQMREIYGVSDTVSDRALIILRTEGLVETLPGVGVFVAERT